MNFIRSSFVWIFSLVVWTGFILSVLPRNKEARLDALMRFARWWGKTALWLGGVEMIYLNESTMKDRKAAVVLVNHQSTLDILWGASVCPPGLLAIGKKEVKYIPILNMIWWAFSLVYVDRSNSQKAIEALSGIENVIVEGKRTLCIAPEGTRTRDGEIRPFKKGAFHIAIGSHAPILPIVVHGAYECMPRGSFYSKPGKIYMKFLEPIPTQGLKKDSLDQLLSETEKKMKLAYDELRRTCPL